MSEVVISGIGSAFSGSGNLQDFGRDLLDNKHLVQRTKRWRDNVFTPVCGQTPYEYFDELFFGISRRLAVVMDPSSKIGYMRGFEAILDAGLHPAALSGSNTGVFASSGINEFEQTFFHTGDMEKLKDGYIIMGMSRPMLPNRLTYYFNFNGPSYAVDGSWVGGLLGLQQAADAIREGRCDAALVVAGSISRYGETSLLLNKLGLVTDEGVTRSFDAKGTGAVRSDGAVALFLQRADQAKRCYARVLATEVEFIGPRCDLNLTLPSPKGTRNFLRRIYEKHAIDPKTIAYLEADGNGNRIRDACELNAIDQALVQEAARESPLQIGSVKSNIGHVDCVNGLAAICKMVVAMETGVIPATINFQEPNSEATGLVAGRLQVVEKNTPLHLSEDSVLAVHTMALSSMVGHAVLGGNPRGPGRVQDPADHLPRLITFSARNEEAAARVVNKIQSAPFHTNYYRLLQDVFSDDIRGYTYRGYVICPSVGNDTLVAPLEKRPVWFVYSGMGSQWAGMGTALMKIPVFAETIDRLHAVLEPRGMDLKAILTETGPTAFDNILKSFVGITACQVALTNVLTAVGVVPEGMVGHSAGELGCAYADGCFTEEQAILAAFARGKASNAVPLIKGKMAAIGLGYQDVLPRLPPTIDNVHEHTFRHDTVINGHKYHDRTNQWPTVLVMDMGSSPLLLP
ncbi:fatty acid synthase-like [Frankliniella occidentalis]|uniref:Fatty acid synthase n=1 Tax=Frankliniella occidentalis TaxID=133901 RepID=A0A9C6WZ89_FRAOC|nr:fatty acid synthase-like [Frankliniella occidentalis]